MALDFPTSPSPNQVHTSGSRSWTWNNSVGAWYAVNAGVQGVQGIQGAQGIQGVQGITGLAFTIAKTYLSVAALTADTAPTGIVSGQFALINTSDVQNSENSRLYLWNGSSYIFVDDLSGSAGIQGITGSQGTVGAQGTQGIQGITGAQGTQGIQGITGAQGITGSQGTVGTSVTGAQGTQGISGASILGLNNTFTGVNSININGTVGATTASTGAFTTLSASGVISTSAGNITALNGILQVGSGSKQLYLRTLTGVNRIDSYDNPITATQPLTINSSIMRMAIADTDRAVLDSTGLAVTGALSSTGNATIGSTATSGNITLGQVTNTTVDNSIRLRTGSTKTAWQIGAQYNVDNGFEITPSTAAGGTTFTTPAFVVSSSGNVGIGTASPAVKLHVQSASAGATALRLTDAVRGTINIDFPATSQIRFDVGAAEKTLFSSGTSTILTIGDINSGGNVGIGTASPATKLDFGGGAANAPRIISLYNSGYYTSGIGMDADAGVRIYSNTSDTGIAYFGTYSTNGSYTWSEKMRIATNGQVQMTNSDGTRFNTLFPSRFGYSTGYMTLVVGATSGNTTVCIGVDPIANTSGAFSGNGSETMFRNVGSFICPNTGNTAYNTIMSWSGAAVTIPGSLSKGSGSFRIEHPLSSKSETHELVHSFIEGPQADLIYRGKVTLVNGAASVNIDTSAKMTEGTFEVLCREVQCFTTNESGWTAIRGKVTGNILTIEAQDSTCTDEISWMVIGERKDKHMLDTEWTDDDGKVIVEPLKPVKELAETRDI